MHDYEHTLQQIKQSLDIVEPASGGFIDQAFIENDVQDGLDRVSKTTMALTDSVNDTLRSIQDIISIPLIDDSDVQQAIHVAKREANATVDKVLQFDHMGTASLQSIKESLRTLSKYVMEMHGAMDNGHLSVKGFSSDQLQHLPTHGTLTEVLEKRASQVAQLTGTSPKQSLNVLDRTTLESLAHYRSVLKTRELVAEFKDIYHSAVNLGKEYISKGFGYLKDGYRFLTKIHGKKITVNEENYDWCGEHGCYRLDDYDRELVGNMWLLSKNGKTDQEAAQATEAFNEALANGDLVLESHHGNVDIYAEQARAAREGYNLWTGEEISEEMANLTIITSVGGTLTGMFYAGRGFNRVPTRNLNLPTPPQKNKNSNNNVNTNINSNQNNNVNSPGAPYRNPNANNSGDIWNVNKSSAKNITLYTNYKEVLKVTQTANPLIDSLRQTGRLPSNYINKEVAIANGWKPGKALNNYVPGGQLGGDVFKNTTNVLPNAPGRVWYEADVGLVNTMSRSKQPGSRLLYSNDGQIYITTDHYKTIHYIGTY